MDGRTLTDKIIPITDLRRNFGEYTANLARLDSLILTKGGEPFAILKALPSEKRKVMRKAAGAWKNTSLDSDSLWKKVRVRVSRRKPVAL